MSQPFRLLGVLTLCLLGTFAVGCMGLQSPEPLEQCIARDIKPPAGDRCDGQDYCRQVRRIEQAYFDHLNALPPAECLPIESADYVRRGYKDVEVEQAFFDGSPAVTSSMFLVFDGGSLLTEDDEKRIFDHARTLGFTSLVVRKLGFGEEGEGLTMWSFGWGHMRLHMEGVRACQSFADSMPQIWKECRSNPFEF